MGVKLADLDEATKALIKLAAEEGAKKALESIGLHDEQAGGDLHDLREILSNWRLAKRAALEQLSKLLTIVTLVGLIILAKKIPLSEVKSWIP